MILDLKDLTLANHDAINFLGRYEAGGITLKNCPAWIMNPEVETCEAGAWAPK